MSLLGVDLVKLCATTGDCSPGDFCNEGGCWPTTLEGSLVVMVLGRCEIEVLNALPSLGKADVVHIRMLGALGPHQKVPVSPMICTQKLHTETGLFSWGAVGLSYLDGYVSESSFVTPGGVTSPLESCCLRVLNWNGDRHTQLCGLLGVFVVYREAKPWVSPAIYWLVVDLGVMLWSQDLTGQGETLNTNKTESQDPRVSYL